jgi:hypothetical protein
MNEDRQKDKEPMTEKGGRRGKCEQTRDERGRVETVDSAPVWLQMLQAFDLGVGVDPVNAAKQLGSPLLDPCSGEVGLVDLRELGEDRVEILDVGCALGVEGLGVNVVANIIGFQKAPVANKEGGRGTASGRGGKTPGDVLKDGVPVGAREYGRDVEVDDVRTASDSSIALQACGLAARPRARSSQTVRQQKCG